MCFWGKGKGREGSGAKVTRFCRRKQRVVQLTVSGNCDYCGIHLLNLSGMWGDRHTQEDGQEASEQHRGDGVRVRSADSEKERNCERLIKGGNTDGVSKSRVEDRLSPAVGLHTPQHFI